MCAQYTYVLCRFNYVNVSLCIMLWSETRLHSREGHLNAVRFLVNEAHCDPNVKDNDGWIPLHYACR